MPALLEKRPPRRSQYRIRKDRPHRRQTPSGVTVLHSAESMLDLIGADTGAEGVAEFIRTRTDPGSYHDLVDSDSCLWLVPYEAEAYQDGTGTNPHALSISWALRATDWPHLSADRTARLLEQGAVAFARQQAWLLQRDYPRTPLVRISAADADRRRPGFVTHGDRDPSRRSDPGGRPDRFPWALWFDACDNALSGKLHRPPTLDLAGDQPMRLYRVRPDREGQPWLRLALMGDGKLRAFDTNAAADAVKAAGIPEQELTRAEYDGLRRGLGELLS